MISGQSLTCPKGASLTFEIDMDTGSDLTGATAQWALCESWFDNAKVYLTKTGTGDGLFIGQDGGVWKITINLAPTDTLDIPSGLLYHDCKVLLQSGDVEDVANGPFSLDPSVNLIIDAPIRRNIQGSQTVGQLGQTASIVTDLVADWYVDSIAGSDSNNGTAQSTPFATLSALQTALTANPIKKKIGLKGGSLWRESLSIGDGYEVTTYGAGIATIDGANVVTAWAAHATAANVYYASITHNSASSTNRLTAYCDGALLRRVADVATCSSTAGSFVDAKASDGSTLTFYIHTPTTSNPASDGHSYEVSIRETGIFAEAGTVITGPIKTQRVMSNNGSTAASGFISNVLAAWGTKHNLLFVGTITDVVSYAADPPTSYEASNIALVAFAATVTGLSYNYRRCGVIQPNSIGDGGAAFYAHSGDGTSVFDSGMLEQCWVVGNISTDAPAGASSPVIQTGCYFNARHAGWTTGNAVQCLSYVDLSGIDVSPLNNVTVTDGASYFEERTAASNFTPGFRLDGPTTLTQCAIACGPGGYMAVINNSGGAGLFAVTKTIMWRGGQHFNVQAGMTYTGDYNIFMADNEFAPTSPIVSLYHGTQYLTLAGWQGGTGQDVNSVYLVKTDQTSGNANAFWLGLSSGANGGPVDGDWRINPNALVYKADGTALTGTFADGTTALTTAGPQNHWNWNTKAPASGPPTAWPNVPKTLADASAYVNNPTAWIW